LVDLHRGSAPDVHREALAGRGRAWRPGAPAPRIRPAQPASCGTWGRGRLRGPLQSGRVTGLVDAHCHLGDAAFDPDREAVLAREVRKRVVVHAGEADDDVAAMLRGADTPVVLHSFSSGPGVFEAGMAIAAYFSFSGMITFKNWAMTDRLTACPPDRLLVETDGPYLAPVPHRGKRNEPAFVWAVAEALARARGESVAAIGQRTTDNARRLFGARLATTLQPG